MKLMTCHGESSKVYWLQFEIWELWEIWWIVQVWFDTWDLWDLVVKSEAKKKCNYICGYILMYLWCQDWLMNNDYVIQILFWDIDSLSVFFFSMCFCIIIWY